jgi:hypothetical protein
MNPDPGVLGYPIDRLPQCGLKKLKVSIGKKRMEYQNLEICIWKMNK